MEAKMKMGLVYPGKKSEEKQIPLGLAYIASYLLQNNKDLEIKVLDTGVASTKETNSFLTERFDVVGFSVTSRSYRKAVSIARTLRSAHDNVKIVFGGPHASIMLAEILAEPAIDFGVYGEGEITSDELVKCLKEAGPRNPTREELEVIDGLIFRDGTETVVNRSREQIRDLDKLPFPAYSLFPMERYAGKHAMMTSRGCPFSCAFCASSAIWSKKWRARSAESVIDEVRYVLRTYGYRPIEFHDDTFNSNLSRVHEICEGFVKGSIKVPWAVRGFRADRVDSRVARDMRQADCVNVALGIESANPVMLERMGKKETIDQISNGIEVLVSAGIDVLGQFMIGNPGETLETVRESIEFARRSGLTRAVFGMAVPFPKTTLWDYVIEHGKFLVEPDCTRFEDISPRIIFETPEFTKEQRLEAARIATEAGMLVHGVTRRNEFRGIAERTMLNAMFKYLPRSLSYPSYFLLRKFSSVPTL